MKFANVNVRLSYGAFVIWDLNSLLPENIQYPLIFTGIEGEFSIDRGRNWATITCPEPLVLSDFSELELQDIGHAQGLNFFNSWFNSIKELKQVGVLFSPHGQQYVVIYPEKVRFWFKFTQSESSPARKTEHFVIGNGGDMINYDVPNPREYTDMNCHTGDSFSVGSDGLEIEEIFERINTSSGSWKHHPNKPF